MYSPFNWYPQLGSNQQPKDYESCALPLSYRGLGATGWGRTTDQRIMSPLLYR